jgi:hypothetical protein
MKKVVILTFLLISGLILKAQDDESTFKLGLIAHPTFGWIKSDISGVSADGIRMGFTYGLIGDFSFADSYAFSTGLTLTTVNGKTETTTGAVTSQEIYKLQYLEIPAKIKLVTNENNGIRFYGEFGLGNGFNVRAKQDVKSTIPTDNVEDKDIYKGTSFYRGSIIIGGGTEIATSGKTKIFAGLTFNNGFTDIKKGDGTLKSSYLGLNLGVFF